jgi:hypothetical protein
LQNLDNELNESQVWQGLKDVDSSPALNYNWTKSESNNFFLASLSIDSRNIVSLIQNVTNNLIVNISVFFFNNIGFKYDSYMVLLGTQKSLDLPQTCLTIHWNH